MPTKATRHEFCCRHCKAVLVVECTSDSPSATRNPELFLFDCPACQQQNCGRGVVDRVFLSRRQADKPASA
jgi:hypothetical protein